MKKFFTVCLALIASFTAHAGNMEYIGTVTGEYYNEFWDMTSEQQMKMYVDEHNIAFTTDSAMPATFFTLDSSATTQEQLLNVAKKGIEWASVAKQNGVDIKKDITEIKGFKNSMFTASFESMNGGQSSVIHVHIKDYENMFYNDKFYINTNHLPHMVSLLEQVPSLVEQAKQTTQNEAMFN